MCYSAEKSYDLGKRLANLGYGDLEATEAIKVACKAGHNFIDVTCGFLDRVEKMQRARIEPYASMRAYKGIKLNSKI